MTSSVRAKLLAHPDHAIAEVDDRLYFADWEPAREGAHHVVPLVAPSEEDSLTHVRLLPLRAFKQRRTAGALIFWAVAWAVGFAFWSQDYEPRGVFYLTALAPLVVAVWLPAFITRRLTKPERMGVVPLRVARESVEADGLHLLEVVEVDGSPRTILATRKLATALLVSSDYARSPRAPREPTGMLMPGIETVGDEPARRAHAAKDVNEAPVVVGAFPAGEVYDAGALEEQLARAARAARSTPEQMRRRFHELEPWFADEEDDEDGVDIMLPRNTTSSGCLMFLVVGMLVPTAVLGLAWVANEVLDLGITDAF